MPSEPSQRLLEIRRRRRILLSHLGRPVRLKRRALWPGDPLHGREGLLVEVRRSWCTVDFGADRRWDVPIREILLPYSSEPAPGQRELAL